MPVLKVHTNKRSEMLNITADIAALIPREMRSGLCHIFSMHTTAGLTINENADPDVRQDISSSLDRIAPWKDSIYHHREGNSAAHIKASLVGLSQTIPVENGRLCLGTWQCVYFCEFDGPRQRSVYVQFIKEID